MKTIRLSLLLVLWVCCRQGAEAGDTFWYHLSGPGTGNRIQSLAVNARGEIFAGTWNSGVVFKSSDNGETWAQCGQIPNTNPVMAIAISQQGHVFASVIERGVYRSTDSGATWALKSTGLTNSAVRGIVIDRSGFLWVASEAGLYRSADDGESWMMKTAGNFGSVYVDSTGAVAANDGAGLHRTTDAGATWTTSLMPSQFSLGGIHPDGSYYACSSSSAIMRSTDLGVTWTDLHSPVSWSWYTSFFTFNRRGDIFYTQDGDASGVLVSTDNGQSWSVINDGLTTTRIIPTLCTPSGYVFLGTNPEGIFRSRYPTDGTQTITVSMPDTLVTRGKTIEVPISITPVTGSGILSCQFTVTVNSPDSILAPLPAVSIAGTLAGRSGWIAEADVPSPNTIVVGAAGAAPLVGSGVLLKLKVAVSAGADSGTTSQLQFSNFLFNAGTPAAVTVNGRITVKNPVCGDADESGVVQAYDAALALREAIGPMPAPPAPLTAQGRLNADVDMNGKVDAYDAALILKHVTGLPMPPGMFTCFSSGGSGDTALVVPPAVHLSASLAGVKRQGSGGSIDVKFAGALQDSGVVAISFDVVTRLGEDLSSAVTVAAPSGGSISMVNRADGARFKVAVINPSGIRAEDITLTVASDRGELLNDIGISGILLNNEPVPDLSITGALTSVASGQQSLPKAYGLIGSYPNPFNPSTRIVFDLPQGGLVTLEIYNALGVRVALLANEVMSGGRHEMTWNGASDGGQRVASGQYFCRMRAAGHQSTIKLVILK